MASGLSQQLKQMRQQRQQRQREEEQARRAQRERQLARETQPATGRKPGWKGSQGSSSSPVETSGGHPWRPSAGTRAMLHGLAAQPDFNGQCVDVLQWNEQKERWLCRTSDSTTMNVRPENLRPATDEAGERQRRDLDSRDEQRRKEEERRRKDEERRRKLELAREKLQRAGVVAKPANPAPSAAPAEEYPLATAVRKGSFQKVMGLLQQGMDVNRLDPIGETPLFKAAVRGNLDIVAALLVHSADARRTAASGMSAADMAKDAATRGLLRFFQGAEADPAAMQ
eukprot:CAMPEP_0179272446 /NCGR_PEP_ID=MMETSP0797-20121207/32501_1 /TAXON_ID=47934 /ORGANISM="Dinophysis acuminata, Strain DAEP01" /LENGTH=283 /DNA_ID=CAMNT_0020980841 /DNA_START=90 /DNA_END=938 /DNA_ORIENTATION=-